MNRLEAVQKAGPSARVIATGDTPLTLSGLVNESEGWDSEFSEVPTTDDRLEFLPNGVMHKGQLIPIDQLCRRRLLDKFNAPWRYFEKHSPRFQAAALAEHATRGDFGRKPTLVLRGGELVTIVRGDLFTLPNADVIRAVGEALGDEGEELSATRIGGDSENLDLELVSPSKAVEVRPGDIVQSGLHVVHHRFGNHATVIEAFIYRLICSNGMTRRECVGEHQSRTRKLPVGFPNNRELQMKQVRRLTQQSWNGLQAQLDAFQATSNRPARVEELLTRWLQRARISAQAMLPRLLAAWRQEGEENTHYGAVNALTRVATHDPELSERQRRVLASLAGLLAFSQVHICDRCFSVLARSTADNAD
jgi:hypothetical protein